MIKVQKICMLLGITLISVNLMGCKLREKSEYTEAAFSFVEARQYEEALEAFSIAEEQGEEPQSIARGRGIAYAGLTQYEKAIESYLDALSYSDLSVDMVDYDLNYYLADAYEKIGNTDKAKAVYDDILTLKENEMNALFLRGKIYLQDGYYDLAIQDFEKTIALEKDAYDLRIEIAGLMSLAGYHEEGMAYLNSFLMENEKKLSDYDKGRIFFYMQDYENAKLALEMAKGENSEKVILLLGKTYEQLGDYNYATSVYKNYLAENTDAAEIYNQLGLCKLKSEEYEEALSAFKSAANVENNGMERTLLFNQIVAHEYTGNFRQAYVLMEDYLKKYPEDEMAIREFEFLKTR